MLQSRPAAFFFYLSLSLCLSLSLSAASSILKTPNFIQVAWVQAQLFEGGSTHEYSNSKSKLYCPVSSSETMRIDRSLAKHLLRGVTFNTLSDRNRPPVFH